MSSSAELACVYAALILHDDGVEVTEEKINTLVKAANVEVEPFWAGLFTKALEGRDVSSLIGNIGSASAAPAAAVAAAAPAKEEEKKEVKKEESESDSDSEGGMGGLFGDSD